MRDLLNTITPPDEVARAEARRRWNDCAKPLGSLGLLETALEDIAELTGSAAIRLDPGSSPAGLAMAPETSPRAPP